MAGAAIPLSFGSFYFAPDSNEPALLEPSGFFDTLRRCLRGIDGVDALEIDDGAHDDQAGPVTLYATVDDGDPTGAYVGPHWDFAQVSFVLTIPINVQRELAAGDAFGSVGERFRVCLAYGWQVPVSCVEILDAPSASPTTAARSVYLYLAREVERSAEKLRLRCIAPIFAHADFFLYPAGDDRRSSPFSRRSHTVPAYHRFEYAFDPDLVTNPVDEFFFEIQGEVDLYYQTADARREQLHAWVDISEALSRLTEARSAGGFWRTFRQAFRPDGLLRNASISLTQFAADRQLVNSRLDRQVRTMYADGRDHFARELIEDAVADRDDYPIEQFSQLLQMFESGRVVELQLVVAFGASLIGAIIGASATLLAGA
jgi:hypothetical protein